MGNSAEDEILTITTCQSRPQEDHLEQQYGGCFLQGVTVQPALSQQQEWHDVLGGQV